ncbi:MAG: HAD family hydrolase [Burkholderiaceae bacterium]|nr:MAG: HAD family hydrolase [Burkholderiaceae bacterium]
MRRAVFLDRDGVINLAVVRDGKPYPPANLAALQILPGVSDALQALHLASYLLIVVTNQPDVARGTTSRAVVEEMNDYLSGQLPIDEFRTCFHDNADNCDCRKPKPGALIAAAKLHGIDLAESYMIGDRWRDILAGQQAGCKTIFIDYGYDEKQPESVDFRVQSLAQAARIILRGTNEKG